MDKPTVRINGHEFIAGPCLTVAGRIDHAPDLVLHILISVNQKVLDGPNDPEFAKLVNREQCRAVIKAAREELGLRSLGIYPARVVAA
jgi:hypothetical protein